MSEPGPDARPVVGTADNLGEGQDADRQPGVAEQATREVLAGDWARISIEQRGPDGTEVIGVVLFAACPVCWAVVPPTTGEIDFMTLHAQWHVKQAHDWDRINELFGLTEENAAESEPQT